MFELELLAFFAIIACQLSITTNSNASTEVLVVGITTSKTHSSYNGYQTAMSLLEEYNISNFINFEFRFDDGNEGLAVKHIVDILKDNRRIYAVVGSARSACSMALGQLLKHYSIPQISPNSASSLLSNKDQFPFFLRMTNSALERNSVRIALLKYFDWKRVFVITQGIEFFYDIYEDFYEKAIYNNITIEENFIIHNNEELKIVVPALLERDARIILVFAYSSMATHFFCQAYKHDMYGDKYVVILPSNVDKYFVSETNFRDLECTIDEAILALDGSFRDAAPDFRLDTYVHPYDSNYDVNQLLQKIYNRMDTISGIQYEANGFDALMTTVLTIDMMIRTNASYLLNAEQNEVGRTLLSSLLLANFQGLLGKIAFDEKGNLRKKIYVQQYRKTNSYDVFILGYFDSVFGELQIDEPIFNVIPRDERIKIEVLEVISDLQFFLSVAFAFFGVLLSIFAISINIIYGEKRLIKMSSPAFNNVIFIGCVLAQMGSIFIILPRHQFMQRFNIEFRFFINITSFLTVSYAFSLSFGGLFLKTYRVYVIFTQRLLHNSKKLQLMQTEVLLSLISFLLLFDSVLSVTSFCLTTPVFESKVLGDALYNEVLDIETHFLVDQSVDSINRYVLFVMLGYKLLLLIIGVFLAILTKDVKLEEMNDSKIIGVLIYNICIVSIFCALLYSFLQEIQPITCDFLISLSISVAASTLVISLMFSKVLGLCRLK